MTLLRASATVGALATVSRAFGYARDILYSDSLGAGPVADAFFVAFRLPNLFHRLFTSALQLAMPWLMFVIAPGFAEDPQRFDLAVTLARIMLFYFLFVLLILHLGGALNVLGRFAAAAAMRKGRGGGDATANGP